MRRRAILRSHRYHRQEPPEIQRGSASQTCTHGGRIRRQRLPLIYKMNYTTPRPVTIAPVTGAAVDSQAITRPARRPTTPRPEPTLVIENVAPVQPEQPAPVAPVRPAQPVFVPQPPQRRPEPVRPILPVVEPVKPIVVKPVEPVRQPILSNNVFLNGQVQMPAPVVPEANNPPKTIEFPSFPTISNIQNSIANQFGSLFNKPAQEVVVQDVPAQPERPIIVAPVAPVVPVTTTTKRPNIVQNFFQNIVKPEQPMRIQAPIIESHVPGAQCGLVNKVQSQYALHDVEVPFGMIPWQAMILSNSEKKLLCSGAIIAPNVVLTSAHCVYGREASDVSAKSGEWKLGYELKHEEPLPFEVINVQKIVTHPNYRHGSSSHDMAMLVLEKNFHLDQHVDTICLPQKPLAFEPAQRRCISTGWGKTIMQIHVAGALMNKLDVELMSPYDCQKRLEGAESPLEIDDSLVCVKAQRQSNNMCQVDVGGPLACDRGDGFYELVGVYSQDTGCLPTNQVATFAVVDYQWINSVMNGAPAPRPVDQYQVPPFVPQLPVQPAPFVPQQPLQPAPFVPQQPLQPAPQQQTIHYHEPGVPCDCRKGTLPAGANTYLPPQRY
ncbi:unnamed protein product [Trichogramma brassicae]|uniref:Peptidase S1 domain-containing protein n=1 Tax=Trichogramma brassicae TaxID=86971 RepID=A0A6H5IRJ4_9HYME|nr:unnamed protein product [Trichogramma brassicae]